MHYALILAGLLGLPSSLSGETVKKAVPVKPTARLHVSNISGSIVIKTHKSPAVRVEADVGAGTEDFKVEKDGEGVVVKVVHGKSTRGRVEPTHIRIWAPATIAIDVKGVSADLDVKGHRGELRARTVSGDVNVTDGSGEVVVDTVSGDVDIAGSKFDLLTTTVSGDLKVRASTLTRFTAKSVSGDVDVRGAMVGSRFNVGTHSGDVVLRGAQGTFEVGTFSGSINGKDANKPRGAPGKTRVELGKGPHVTVETFSGDVSIDR